MSPRMGLTQTTILQAAAEIADNQGMEAVTLASLAQKLGIRSPSLYNHVNGLQGVRNMLAIHGLEQLYAVMTHACSGRSSDNAVRAIADAYLTFARTHPGLYEASLPAPDAQNPEWAKAGTQVVDLVAAVFQDYRLEEEEVIHAVRGFRSIIHGFSSLEQRGGFGLPLNLDISFRKAVDMFLAGIHASRDM